ncbi:MAG: hypothetical protein R6T98_08890, partial [Desulfatiglandales bacterium]
PTIGKKVKMFSGSKILGNCKIEDNVIISANCYVKDEKISSYSLVFGSTPNLIVKYRPEYFKGAIHFAGVVFINQQLWLFAYNLLNVLGLSSTAFPKRR